MMDLIPGMVTRVRAWNARRMLKRWRPETPAEPLRVTLPVNIEPIRPDGTPLRRRLVTLHWSTGHTEERTWQAFPAQFDLPVPRGAERVRVHLSHSRQTVTRTDWVMK